MTIAINGALLTVKRINSFCVLKREGSDAQRRSGRAFCDAAADPYLCLRAVCRPASPHGLTDLEEMGVSASGSKVQPHRSVSLFRVQWTPPSPRATAQGPPPVSLRRPGGPGGCNLLNSLLDQTSCPRSSFCEGRRCFLKALKFGSL